jgi:hypothetical protein
MITTILLSRKEQENFPSESHLPMKEYCCSCSYWPCKKEGIKPLLRRKRIEEITRIKI